MQMRMREGETRKKKMDGKKLQWKRNENEYAFYCD